MKIIKYKTQKTEYYGSGNPNFNNHKLAGINGPGYLDGRTLVPHYCKEKGCNNEISLNNWRAGNGRCRSCAAKMMWKTSTKIKARDTSGENNGNYKNGKSKEPYSLAFTEKLKRQIRERDDYTCQLCGKIQEDNNKALDVHHIDYNKKNCSEDNLISLCIFCHGKTNGNRKYWSDYFICCKKQYKRYCKNR